MNFTQGLEGKLKEGLSMSNKIIIEGWIDKDGEENIIIRNDRLWYGDTLAEIINEEYKSDEILPSTLGECDDYMGGVSLFIPNCSLRFYHSKKKLKLEEVQEKYLKQLFGDIDIFGENYGYSEYTILGLDVEQLVIGGHNLEEILSNYIGEYTHIIIEY